MDGQVIEHRRLVGMELDRLLIVLQRFLRFADVVLQMGVAEQEPQVVRCDLLGTLVLGLGLRETSALLVEPCHGDVKLDARLPLAAKRDRIFRRRRRRVHRLAELVHALLDAGRDAVSERRVLGRSLRQHGRRPNRPQPEPNRQAEDPCPMCANETLHKTPPSAMNRHLLHRPEAGRSCKGSCRLGGI